MSETSIHEVLAHAAAHGAPPPAASVEDVLYRVNEYVTYLDREGGVVALAPRLEYKPRGRGPQRVLRPSAAGKCPRALAYQKLFPELAEPLTPRALSVFMLGHLVHDLERHLIAQVNPLTDVEREVVFDFDGEAVAGHIDGILHLASGPVLLDVKTTNAASFERMLREGPSPDYVAQLNVYLHATGLREGFLWLFNKDTAHRTVLPVEYQPEVVEAVRERWEQVRRATADALPPRAYAPQAEVRKGQPTGREYLPWQCGYCAFVQACWGGEGFTKTVEGGKPRWVREA